VDRTGLPETGGPAPIEAVYWFDPLCRDCEDFLFDFVPDLARESGRTINLGEKDIRDPEIFDELRELLEGRGVPFRNVPVLVMSDAVFQGNMEIEEGLRAMALNPGAAGATEIPADEPRDRRAGEGGARWEIGPVFLAGLLDGVNPCAFTAMVFLVSALAVAGRNRRTMLVTGITYALGVFITYTLVGAGLLGGAGRISSSSSRIRYRNASTVLSATAPAPGPLSAGPFSWARWWRFSSWAAPARSTSPPSPG
jgi:hypothetical protein